MLLSLATFGIADIAGAQPDCGQVRYRVCNGIKDAQAVRLVLKEFAGIWLSLQHGSGMQHQSCNFSDALVKNHRVAAHTMDSTQIQTAITRCCTVGRMLLRGWESSTTKAGGRQHPSQYGKCVWLSSSQQL